MSQWHTMFMIVINGQPTSMCAQELNLTGYTNSTQPLELYSSL